MPFDFRLHIFLISMANFAFCFLWEKCILEHYLRQAIKRIKLKFKVKSGKKFKAIEQEIKADIWPFNNIVSNNRGETLTSDILVGGNQLTRSASQGKL